MQLPGAEHKQIQTSDYGIVLLFVFTERPSFLFFPSPHSTTTHPHQNTLCFRAPTFTSLSVAAPALTLPRAHCQLCTSRNKRDAPPVHYHTPYPHPPVQRSMVRCLSTPLRFVPQLSASSPFRLYPLAMLRFPFAVHTGPLLLPLSLSPSLPLYTIPG